MIPDWKLRAKKALEEGMASDLSQIYFNDPVDAVALGIPEYYDVIKKPMDLGTCKAKLMRGEYAHAQELLLDIQLVWSNCRLFNTPGSDVVEACEDVERVFKDLWRKYSLVLADANANAGGKDKSNKASTSLATTKTNNTDSAKGTKKRKKPQVVEVETEEEEEEEEEEEVTDKSKQIPFTTVAHNNVVLCIELPCVAGKRKL